MYKVYSDNLLLYHSNLENLQIFNPSLELELNKTGSFDFTIHPDHPYYSFIKKLKSIITVYQDDYLLFRGRVLDDEIGWYNEKFVVCEGDMAFMLDSMQRPFTFTGTATEVLSHIIENHNSQVDTGKRFVAGSVTVDGTFSVDLTEYTSTLETLQKALVELHGGYLKTSTENGVTYLDYLSEITLLSPQTIEFGKNLLDLKRIRKGSDIATALIPLGKDGLTIASVNNDLDYIVDEEAKAQFGFIVKTANFDDIDNATALFQAGKAHLNELVNAMESIELTAADLATVDKDITSFHIGTQVQVTSNPHGLDQRFTVSKLSIKLLDPAANKLVLGKTISTFSETVVFLRGAPGKPGEPGKDGSPGKDGVNGAAGKDGTPGANGKDGKDGRDGVGVASITEQYYLSTSATALSGGSWTSTVPAWVNGRYMWTKSVIIYTDNTSSETNPKCVTGAKGSNGAAGSPGANGQDGISVTKVDVQYYQSTSSTALSGGSWQTTAPAWVNGRFFWEKTVITYSDGSTEESKPVCITGQQGPTGATGPAGKDGATGPTGPAGKDGVNGKDGANGKDGKDAAVQSLTAPTDTAFLWLDISVDPPLLKRYDPDAAAWKVVNDTTSIVYNLEQNFKSDIEQTEQLIRSSVSESVYLKDDVDGLISKIQSDWTQTAGGFQMDFTKLTKDIEDVANGTDAEFEEIRKYIRFEDGNIIQGEAGSQFQKVQSAERESYYDNGKEVAYFSNQMLHVTDGEFLNSLQVGGGFGFKRRENGHLSFGKMT